MAQDPGDRLDLEELKALTLACTQLRESAEALLAKAKEFYQQNFEQRGNGTGEF